MKRSIRAALLGLAVIVPVSCVSKSVHMAAVNSNRGLSETLAQYDQYLKELEAENRALRADNRLYKSAVKDASAVKAQKERLRKLIEEIENRGFKTSGGDVQYFRTSGGGVGLRIQGKVLFPSGRAVITESGKKTLAKVSAFLKSSKGRIVVNGHTDSDPIRRSSWKSNLHLSVARALSVAEVLRSQGVDPDRLRVGGYGPNEPVSRSDKALNRRVEILIEAPN